MRLICVSNTHSSDSFGFGYYDANKTIFVAQLPFFCDGSILRQDPQVWLDDLDTVAPISPPATYQ